MKKNLVLWCYRLAFLALATYGLLYFSYKYYVPWEGGNDFESYYPMYLHPLDFGQAQAPFVYRQLGAVITNAIYRSGIYYPDLISFSHPEYDQRVFFSALVSNYAALLLTAVVVGATVDRLIGQTLLFPPIVGGLLCFAFFFTQQSVITGLTEGWSWFLVAVGFCGYVGRRRSLVIAAVLLSVFQRETIPILFLVLSIVDALLSIKRRSFAAFHLWIAASSLLALLGDLFVRRVLIPVGGYYHQLDLQAMLSYLRRSFPFSG